MGKGHSKKIWIVVVIATFGLSLTEYVLFPSWVSFNLWGSREALFYRFGTVMISCVFAFVASRLLNKIFKHWNLKNIFVALVVLFLIATFLCKVWPYSIWYSIAWSSFFPLSATAIFLMETDEYLTNAKKLLLRATIFAICVISTYVCVTEYFKNISQTMVSLIALVIFDMLLILRSKSYMRLIEPFLTAIGLFVLLVMLTGHYYNMLIFFNPRLSEKGNEYLILRYSNLFKALHYEGIEQGYFLARNDFWRFVYTSPQIQIMFGIFLLLLLFLLVFLIVKKRDPVALYMMTYLICNLICNILCGFGYYPKSHLIYLDLQLPVVIVVWQLINKKGDNQNG